MTLSQTSPADPRLSTTACKGSSRSTAKIKPPQKAMIVSSVAAQKPTTRGRARLRSMRDQRSSTATQPMDGSTEKLFGYATEAQATMGTTSNADTARPGARAGTEGAKSSSTSRAQSLLALPGSLSSGSFVGDDKASSYGATLALTSVEATAPEASL